MHRYIALSGGLILGRMIFTILSCFLGLVVLCTIGLLAMHHWILASMLFIGGNWLHSTLWARLTRGR